MKTEIKLMVMAIVFALTFGCAGIHSAYADEEMAMPDSAFSAEEPGVSALDMGMDVTVVADGTVSKCEPKECAKYTKVGACGAASCVWTGTNIKGTCGC